MKRRRRGAEREREKCPIVEATSQGLLSTGNGPWASLSHGCRSAQLPLPQASLRLSWTLNRHFVNKRSSHSARPLARAALVNSAEGSPGGEGKAGSNVVPSRGPRGMLWTSCSFTSLTPVWFPAVSSSRRYLQDARTSPSN